MLPTPRTSDTNGPGLHGDGGMDLRTAVKLLPTPTARDGKDVGDLWKVPENSLLPRVVWNHFSRPPQQPTGSDGP